MRVNAEFDDIEDAPDTLFEDRDEARSEIFDYLEVFYNRQRIHQSLGFTSPVNYEKMADVA